MVGIRVSAPPPGRKFNDARCASLDKQRAEWSVFTTVNWWRMVAELALLKIRVREKRKVRQGRLMKRLMCV